MNNKINIIFKSTELLPPKIKLIVNFYKANKKIHNLLISKICKINILFCIFLNLNILFHI